MNIRALIKAALANVVPWSVYVAINARIAARDIATKRRWAPEIDLLPRFVHTGDTVVDVGGNHGLYTYHLSRLVGPSGRVHTFEPLPPNLDILRYTIKTHRLDNVTVYPKACGEKTEQAAFGVPVNRGTPELGGARRGNEGLTFDCSIVRLDDVIATKVSFLKIDVEGAELFVLRGAERLLSESRPVILFEAGGHTQDLGYEQQAVFDFLSDHGYRFVSGGFRGKALEPRECFTDAEDYFALPKDDLARTCCGTSPQVPVP
jgi:FkbM family methyltransferase